MWLENDILKGIKYILFYKQYFYKQHQAENEKKKKKKQIAKPWG